MGQARPPGTQLWLQIPPPQIVSGWWELPLGLQPPPEGRVNSVAGRYGVKHWPRLRVEFNLQPPKTTSLVSSLTLASNPGSDFQNPNLHGVVLCFYISLGCICSLLAGLFTLLSTSFLSCLPDFMIRAMLACKGTPAAGWRKLSGLPISPLPIPSNPRLTSTASLPTTPASSLTASSGLSPCAARRVLAGMDGGHCSPSARQSWWLHARLP